MTKTFKTRTLKNPMDRSTQSISSLFGFLPPHGLAGLGNLKGHRASRRTVCRCCVDQLLGLAFSREQRCMDLHLHRCRCHH